MKKILLTALTLIIGISTYAQSPHNILRQYKNNDGVMSLKFDGDIMGMLDNDNGEEIKSELEFMDVIMFKEGGDISDADKAKLKAGLEADNYELLINAKDKGNRVKVMGLQEGETISQVFINANTEKANIYVVVKGKLYFDELKKLNLDRVDNFFD